MALQSGWFENFKGTAEERQKLSDTIKGSGYVLDILSDWIEKQLKELQSVSRDDYDNPNWALLMADKNGEIRALTKVLKMTRIERTK